MYVHRSIKQGEPDQNRMVVDIRDFTAWDLLMLLFLFQKLTNFPNFKIFGHFYIM